MSFFGLPQKEHNSRMPGFGQAPDHFAALKAGGQLEEDKGWVLAS